MNEVLQWFCIYAVVSCVDFNTIKLVHEYIFNNDISDTDTEFFVGILCFVFVPLGTMLAFYCLIRAPFVILFGERK